MVYDYILRRRVRQTFQALNQAQYEVVLRQFAPTFEYRFSGDHPLGGVRHTRDATRRWYQRLSTLFPDLQFTVTRVICKGPLWDTLVTVEWQDRLTTLDGEQWITSGLHLITLRWAQVMALRIYCDTALLQVAIQRQADLGLKEAADRPITDDLAA